MKRRIALLAVLLFAAAGTSAGTPAPRPVIAPASLVQSGAGGVSFRVDFDAPEWTTVQSGERTYRYPAWKGLGIDGTADAPALPARTVRVALPPDGEVSLEVDAESRAEADGVRFPPVPGWAPGPSGLRPPSVESVPVARVREGSAYAATRPEAQAEIVSIGWERGLRVANVAVRPVRWTPSTGRAEWDRSVTVTLAVASGPRTAALAARPRPIADAAARSEWNETLVNPADAARWQVSPRAATAPPGPDGVPAHWFDDAPGWVKIDVDHNGVFVLDRARLAAAGVPVATVDPRTFRIFSGPLLPEVAWGGLRWVPGALYPAANVHAEWDSVSERPGFSDGLDSGAWGEHDIWVEGADDGTFDAGDDVVFYGLGPDNYRDRFGQPRDGREDYLVNPYTGHTVYWLTWSGDFAGAPHRMDAVDAAPGSGAPVVTDGRARLHLEQNTFYDGSRYWPGYRWEGWFWQYLSTRDAAGQRFPVDLPQVVAGTTLDATIRLWGANLPNGYTAGDEALHHVDVTVNGVDQPLQVWGGPGDTGFMPRDVIVTGVPAVDPQQPTGSQAVFRFVLPQVGSNPDRYDLVYLTWIDVAYRKSLEVGGAAAEVEVDAGDPGRVARIGGAPSGSLLAFDVTDFRHPRRLTGVSAAGGNVSLALDRASARILAVTSRAQLAAPAEVTADTPPRLHPGSGPAAWLRDTGNPVDYVIVTDDAFAGEAEVLAGWRRQHLPPITPAREARVRVVKISDIMDEFTWGMWDPVAVRYFLEYAYRYYGDPAVDDRLSYCFFLGDHTYDFRDYDHTGQKDQVPSWDDNRDGIGFSQFTQNYTTDDPLARFDGLADRYTDLYLGRLTPHTLAEARAVIEDKVIRAEAQPVYGSWRTRAVLVADDVCQDGKYDPIGFGHMSQSEEVDSAIPSDFERDKIYLYRYGEDCSILTKPQAKKDLLAAWSAGAWLVNYIGHGADVVMADEHVFDVADVPLLTNQDRLPILGAFSCSVGRFSDPNQTGIGEGLAMAPRAGTLVSLAATHVTDSGSNSSFNLIFMQKLFPADRPVTDPVSIGVAFMETKRLLERSTAKALKYACLGDPASRLSVPFGQMSVDGPERLERGSTVSVTARVAGGGSRSGTLEVTARDAREFVDKNAEGIPIRNLGGPPGYYLSGALLFRGTSPVEADSATAAFTVPVSLRGGPDGSIRAYASGSDWDAFGVLDDLPVVLQGSASPDTVGPDITVEIPSGGLVPGSDLAVGIADSSGINLTRVFDFLAIQLKIFDLDGLEQVRLDLTDRFQYEPGSHTRGGLSFPVPSLEPGAYDFVFIATDNQNNRTQLTERVQVGARSGDTRISAVAAYPNPFRPGPEATRILYTLDRDAAVTFRVYSVAGRLVRKFSVSGRTGFNSQIWDGADETGDPVANGVYLVQIAAKGLDGGGTARHLERLVVLR